jgi:hypothetical protein
MILTEFRQCISRWLVMSLCRLIDLPQFRSCIGFSGMEKKRTESLNKKKRRSWLKTPTLQGAILLHGFDSFNHGLTELHHTLLLSRYLIIILDLLHLFQAPA